MAPSPATADSALDGGPDRPDRLGPTPAFLLRPLDPTGNSATTLNVPLEQLSAGPYAIALHAAPEEFGNVIACADLPID